MKKIKEMVNNIRDCYIPLGDSRIYLLPINSRKPVTLDTQDLSLATMALKICELIDEHNALVDEVSAIKEKK